MMSQHPATTRSRHSRGRGLTIISLLLAGGLLLSACGSGDEDGGQVARAADGPPRGMAGGPPGGPPGGDREIPVAARIAFTEDLQVTLRGSTNLRARETVDVIPKQSGLVGRILVEEGDRVQQGQLLAQLDDEEWRLQMEQSRARARSSAEQVDRARALAALDLISEQEVGNLVADSAVAASDLELAELRVRNAQILSPIAGVITHRYIERGAQVGTAEAAFTVADVDRLEARVAVPERQAPRIQVGQAARILFQEGAAPVATGTVQRIRPVVDAESGTVQVTVEVLAREDDRLRPGQFVNVDIVTETLPDRITLPRTAVLVDGAVPRVFVVRDGRAEERQVTLGFSRGDQVEIATGLAAGDTVVVVGQDNLRPNAPVRLMELDGRPVEGRGQ
ncbi:MAG: efflux RND transporter periplasmic adaptor subunit [Gemmatimonadales bacterium]|nr:MAG: efflux RND transporter periplasmic adaptor subunit [Gemmatimonadales bacterium]